MCGQWVEWAVRPQEVHSDLVPLEVVDRRMSVLEHDHCAGRIDDGRFREYHAYVLVGRMKRHWIAWLAVESGRGSGVARRHLKVPRMGDWSDGRQYLLPSASRQALTTEPDSRLGQSPRLRSRRETNFGNASSRVCRGAYCRKKEYSFGQVGSEHQRGAFLRLFQLYDL